MLRLLTASLLAAVALVRAPLAAESQLPLDLSPRPDEQQLPRAMRAPVDEGPRISVGRANADLIGADNRALQAAVDYIAQLGGGTVEIGPGEFVMHDSLHLRANVIVRGQKDKTILRKAPGHVSALALDGDYGEEQITLVEPAGFVVGAGVAIWDSRSGGFHTTVARIIGRRGAHTFAISVPLQSDCMVANKAQAATVFPVVSACNVEGVRIEDLTVDGNRAENAALNGCRGAGIYLFRAHGAVIRGCTVRRFNGDGISFQACNDVTVEHCVSEDNAALGIHPGSGSQRPVVRNCTARGNGTDGLFLCWRVRHGLFEENLLENNGQFGISIGHKDSDNLLRRNTVRRNRSAGVFFRNETVGMGPHRNRLEDNLIEDNGTSKTPAAGIRIRGEAYGLVFKNNIIRDTRPEPSRTQTVGVLIEETVGEVVLDGNAIEAAAPVEDRRKSAGKSK
ncbi:MAG: right-handed parallel beta-helix repeat-containing protein [Candidatus Sumerlaeia bacterium]|nr:right-handed parallel beta-helix repeat-containing protein [Candidatus Sumerlaeia bacterium]